VISFKQFIKEAYAPIQQGAGTLQGAMPGGANNNWGGALPKLISILPPGNWAASSQKRGKMNTASGGVSDHWTGNANTYAGDFGLNTTFGGNQSRATEFAIGVANRAGQGITSWQPYVGKILTFETGDKYRIQIIWQSNVGGNHYDHVHVGVKALDGAAQTFPNNPSTPNALKTSEDQNGEPTDVSVGNQGAVESPNSSPLAAINALQTGFNDFVAGTRGGY
jgi:hypothetical protein